VTLTAYDGKTKITFWPDDIKALITAWWAQAHYDTDFMGNSCTSTKVTKDTTTGLYLGKNCASNNAASWHIVFGNHVGIEKKVLFLILIQTVKYGINLLIAMNSNILMFLQINFIQIL